ncbi:MAG TPA: hypothetical protein VL096_06240, partial [Pirellulaceae bacterium]|nr:hypothetical protein [Pirellulaceae bacterium]
MLLRSVLIALLMLIFAASDARAQGWYARGGLGVDWVRAPGASRWPLLITASSPPRVLAQPLRREVEATTDSIDAAVGYRWGEDSSLPVLGSDLRLEATTHWFDLREADSERLRAADFGGTLVTSPYLHPTVTNNVQG